MKHTNAFVFAATVVAGMIFSLSSCNPDIQLGNEENIPEVAEHLLGLDVQNAMQYLEKQGFCYGNKPDYVDEYVFSRDGALSEFSYEATAMLMFGVDDKVRYVFAIQRPKTEQAARNLYWKWSHYTAQVTLPKVENWSGSLVVKDLEGSHLKDQWTSYTDGSSSKQMLDSYRNRYEKGEITQEEYEMWLAVYSMTRDVFWTDFKNDGENVKSANEHYTDNSKPKEVEIIYYANNGGEINLYYETHNYVKHWE